MSSPTTHQFLLAIDNGNTVPQSQLVRIDVIVSIEGAVQLAVRTDSGLPGTSNIIVHLGTTNERGRGADALDGIPSTERTSAREQSTAPAETVFPGPTATQTQPTVIPATVATASAPPAYTPGTPPPAYSPASTPLPTFAAQPLFSAPSPHTGTINGRGPGGNQLQLHPHLSPPDPTAHTPRLRTQIRGRALPERRRRIPPPASPPPAMDGPGLLSAVLSLGLELLPLKRRPDSDGLEGRYAKRRRL